MTLQATRRLGSFASPRPTRAHVVADDPRWVAAEWAPERSAVRLRTLTPADPGLLLSTEQLTAIVVRAGARVVSTNEHGNFLAIRRHLVFVPRARFVGARDLADVLGAAGMTTATCRELLAGLGGTA